MAIKYQFDLITSMRIFFSQKGFIDVLTPPLVQNPGMETHIHPFGVITKDQEHKGFLHTSPEFHMKALLSHGLEKIFTISYCFRDEPSSPHHRNQFVMCEWYRAQERYEKIMQDTVDLIQFCYNDFKRKKAPVRNIDFSKVEKKTIQELFFDFLDFDILDYLDKEKLKKLIEKKFPDVPLPAKGEHRWDDYFFLLFLNKIEPKLKNYPFLVLYEYPAPLSALSTLKDSDPRVCERFEVYINGIELCNCFNELTDLEEQKSRFEFQNQEKKSIYGYSLPKPELLYSSLKKGFPKSAGIALGVERLLLSLLDIENPFYPDFIEGDLKEY